MIAIKMRINTAFLIEVDKVPQKIHIAPMGAKERIEAEDIL